MWLGNMKKDYHEIWVIMGGGITETLTLPDNVIKRCQWVIENFRAKNIGIICSSSFSLNVPPKKNKSGNIVSEASIIYDFLSQYIDKEYIYCEQMSHDTVGSILFTLMMFAQEFNVKNVKYITSDFHKDRVFAVAKFLNKIIFEEKFCIEVIGVLSANLSPNRTLHEKYATNDFIEKSSSLKCRQDFFENFFRNHTNYNHTYSGRKLIEDSTY
jgi:hypothetical protein